MRATLFFAVLSITACTTPSENQTIRADATGVSQQVADAVTLCSAGSEITRSTRLELSLELSNLLNGVGTADVEAEVSNAIEGIVFKDADLTDENVVESQKVYTDCVTTNLSQLSIR